MKKRKLGRLSLVGLMSLAIGFSASGHETDQFTLPAGRDFADLGDYFSSWAFQTIERGVNKTNKRIEQCIAQRRGPGALAQLQTPDAIVFDINDSFPNAYDVIEGLETIANSKEIATKNPGTVIGYKELFTNIFQHVHFPLDPRQLFRLWHASTIKVYGVYLGGDKIGHFTDMGMHYFKAYREALKKGKSETQAVAVAVNIGTEGPIFSERGMVGYLSAGAYSNGDLAANYLGFLFYKNMTDPVMLKGKLQPPMLVREGEYWKIAPHIRTDSDFFALFVSEHFNEAYNPSLFESSMRSDVRKAVKLRTEVILGRFCDTHGNRRPRQHFDSMQTDLATYYGADYGHQGNGVELITVGNSCFDRFASTAKPSDRDTCGNTPLHVAVAYDDREVVRRMIEQGADVNAPVRSSERYSSEWGNTPLHVAARDGSLEVVKILLAAGANADLRNDRGQTALHRASMRTDVAAMLLQKGAAVDAADNRGQTVLHWAAKDGSAAMIELLLGHGASADARDFAGESSLHAAARCGSVETVAALLRRGANANALASFGNRPIHLAAAAGHAEIAAELITHGASIDSKDEFGWTALHDAANQGRDSVVTLLLSKNADPSPKDIHGSTPLHLAARAGRSVTANLLMSHGAELNARNNLGATPLHEASFAGQRNIVSALLTHGADATTKNVKGRTAMEIASGRGFVEVATLLRSGRQVANVETN